MYNVVKWNIGTRRWFKNKTPPKCDLAGPDKYIGVSGTKEGWAMLNYK
jgi:hypothetical protein